MKKNQFLQQFLLLFVVGAFAQGDGSAGIKQATDIKP